MLIFCICCFLHIICYISITLYLCRLHFPISYFMLSAYSLLVYIVCVVSLRFIPTHHRRSEKIDVSKHQTTLDLNFKGRISLNNDKFRKQIKFHQTLVTVNYKFQYPERRLYISIPHSNRITNNDREC